MILGWDSRFIRRRRPATHHRGIPEGVADGVTGTLVPERNSEKLAGAILELLEDRDLWQQYHLATQAHIDEDSIFKKQTALLENFYANRFGGR